MSNRRSGSINDADAPLLPHPPEDREAAEEPTAHAGGPALTTCGFDRNKANVITMGLAFLLVFTAFQTTQIFAVKLLGDLGAISVGIIYVGFAIGGGLARCSLLAARAVLGQY